ncbi:MAG: ABC transporter ATP-binding protein [Bacteroidales bacterium]|nr:ABC transporter ATP-binding protein [Bacteroidales bacterium]
MDVFFDIQHYTCGYYRKFYINDINFTVKKGSLTGIIGPNGSGKTTLFKGITCELKAKDGKILLNGKEIARMSYRERARNFAIVTQKIEGADIRVEDYVMMGRLPYHSRFQFFETKNDIEIVEKYMKFINISHLRHKLMNELSGGEQQLVSIARALTQEPELLLLDEPTSHLDISHQVQLMNLIQRLNAQLGLTVLMIIHDLNLAGEYCDYLVLLKDGNVFNQGIPEDVLTYKNIEDVYGTVVITKTNPLSGKPVIFPVSERTLKQVQDSRN